MDIVHVGAVKGVFYGFWLLLGLLDVISVAVNSLAVVSETGSCKADDIAWYI